LIKMAAVPTQALSVDVRFFRACHQFAFCLDLDFGDAAAKSGAKLLTACLQSSDMQLAFQSFFPRNLFPENSAVNHFARKFWRFPAALARQALRSFLAQTLLDVRNNAEPLMLTQSKIEAEVELEWIAKDKDCYQLLAERAFERQRDGACSRFGTEGKTIVNKVQNKFADACQLMKEGQTKGNATLNCHNSKTKGDAEGQHLVDHSRKTLCVNAIVKNSVQVVSHELERLARQERVENVQNNLKNKVKTRTGAERFRKFREAAQGNLVKLAGLALASDFAPRRIAVQLSNDLCRQVTQQLFRIV
jgi:hypothetical protein